MIEVADQSTERQEALRARRRLFEDLGVGERRVEAAGISTAVVEGGDGPTLILLHGQGGSAVAWIPVMRRLLASHRPVVPDLPGLGESVVSEGELDVDRVISWMDEVLAATAGEPAWLVGISLGGTFAAHHLIRRPGAARGAVLVDSGSLAPFRPDPRVMPSLIRASLRPTEENIERFFRHAVADLERVEGVFGPKWPDLLSYGRERFATPSVQAANRRLLRRLGVRQIPESDLRSIDAPVSLVWGREDKVMKARIAEEASVTYGWPLKVIEDAGHAVFWDRPDEFVDALEELLGAR